MHGVQVWVKKPFVINKKIQLKDVVGVFRMNTLRGLVDGLGLAIGEFVSGRWKEEI